MELNAHNKQEYPPMHTAEHILNGTMVRMFGCGRSFSAHIERKKSKCDYRLATPLSESQLRGVEDAVKSGRISESRIDESVCRILTAKQAMGLLDEFE